MCAGRLRPVFNPGEDRNVGIRTAESLNRWLRPVFNPGEDRNGPAG